MSLHAKLKSCKEDFIVEDEKYIAVLERELDYFEDRKSKRIFNVGLRREIDRMCKLLENMIEELSDDIRVARSEANRGVY